jgi:MFS family permease
MAAFLSSLGHDAGNNFRQLFNIRQEQVIVIDEDGKEKTVCMPMESPASPLRLLGMIKWQNWMFFFCAYFAFVADYLDFQLLQIQTKKLAMYYGTSKSTIASSITFTLLLRPVGAALIGLSSDYFGRKYPLALACIFLAAMQVATIYCRTLPAFLGVRALFGIGMGAIWGSTAALAMEGCPTQARGLMSGSECFSSSPSYSTS